MKFRMMNEIKKKGYRILNMCKLFEASSSGFYNFLEDRGEMKSLKDKELGEKIEHIFKKNKGRYGSPRIYRELRVSSEENIGENKVARIMKLKKLNARRRSSYIPKTTKNNTLSKKSPRLFKIEENDVKKENQIWCSDLTYLPFMGSFMYLVVFLDLYNREVKSWKLCDGMEAIHSKRALREGIKSVRGSLDGLIIHSDQGVQYCSKEFRDELEFFSLSQSMSRKGNCYDNAFVESFFHTLKTELEWKHCTSMEELEQEIAIYMDWYNKERMHSSLEYLSPKEFKQRRSLRA